MPSFSIIIPTLNEERNLPLLLDDLAVQTLSPNHILIVDGFSTDKTFTIVTTNKKVAGFQIPKNPSLQRNWGGNKSSDDLLIFMDADVRFPENFLEKAIQNFQANSYDIACPYYVPYHSTVTITAIYYFFNSMFFLFQRIFPSGAGSCILVKKKVFAELGGFNPELTYDDIAFIRQAGRKCKFGMLPLKIWVSDRRFRRYGILPTFITYLGLTVLFMLGLFKLANYIQYHFGEYKNAADQE